MDFSISHESPATHRGICDRKSPTNVENPESTYKRVRICPWQGKQTRREPPRSHRATTERVFFFSRMSMTIRERPMATMALPKKECLS